METTRHPPSENPKEKGIHSINSYVEKTEIHMGKVPVSPKAAEC